MADAQKGQDKMDFRANLKKSEDTTKKLLDSLSKVPFPLLLPSPSLLPATGREVGFESEKKSEDAPEWAKKKGGDPEPHAHKAEEEVEAAAADAVEEEE